MASHPTRSLFFVALGHLSVELCSQFLPVLYPVLIAALNLSYTQVGVIAMVAGIGTSLIQPFFGYLSDRWNPRLIVVLAVAWTGLLMGLVGLTGGYVSLILLVGLGVLGSAAFHPAAMSITSSCGGERRGIATSIFSLGGTIGTALSPLWVTAGLARMGMRGTLVLIPVAVLGSALIYWQTNHLVPRQGDPSATIKTAMGRRTIASLVWIVLAVMFLAWFQWSFRTYLPTWIEEQGRSLAVAGRAMFVFASALGAGTLLGGALSDRLGRWQLLAVCLVLLGPVAWVLLQVPIVWQIPVVAVLGILIGATFPISIVMAQETWPSGVGTASGLVMGLGWVPGGIGASLTGRVADAYSLTMALRLLVVPAALSAACILAYALVQRSSPEPRALEQAAGVVSAE
ncbi:MAG: MFS transporter [Anaerolineae bacterium]|nr:MAG: MFS transporter [Anaerolineae bacterium]